MFAPIIFAYHGFETAIPFRHVGAGFMPAPACLNSQFDICMVYTYTVHICRTGSASPIGNATADEVMRRIEELKNLLAPVEAPKLFHYDPDKPLTLRPKTEKPG
jgi:hypothetical protein